MYELKKNGKVFTSKSVGTGPSSYEKKKKNLPGRGLTKVAKHCKRLHDVTCLKTGSVIRSCLHLRPYRSISCSLCYRKTWINICRMEWGVLPQCISVLRFVCYISSSSFFAMWWSSSGFLWYYALLLHFWIEFELRGPISYVASRKVRPCT